MKKLIWFVLPILLWSCEDVIDFDLGEPGPSQLVVDAMLTNQDTLQVVQLSLSQPYFSRAGLVPAQGAEVFVFADDSTRYTFINQGNGRYVYDPKKVDHLIVLGGNTPYMFAIKMRSMQL